MSNVGTGTFDFGYRTPQYAESTEELYDQARVLIESIKDDCVVTIEEHLFSISKNLEKTPIQIATPTTGGMATLSISQRDSVGITCKNDGCYSLTITVNSRTHAFNIKDDKLYEEYKDFFSEKWEKQINEEAIKSINELFNQTELKRKVDLDNLLK